MKQAFMESQATPYEVPADSEDTKLSLAERAKLAEEKRKQFLKESTIPAQDGFINLSE